MTQDVMQVFPFSIWELTWGHLLPHLLQGFGERPWLAFRLWYWWHWDVNCFINFPFYGNAPASNFNELRQEANSCSKPVVENKNAPKIVFSFLFAVAAVIALTILGIIHINPVAVATYLTVGISIGIIAYFAYLLLS